MARIRTIKPDFFRHEGLFEAERETGLPLRVAFIGLWTAADREGRFEWRPRQLKLDCLPYDEIDFSRVLDALRTRGFIVSYTEKGERYGVIPSWKQHQFINNREIPSVLPAPENSSIESIASTRDERVSDETPPENGNCVKGRGREGERKGKEKNASPSAPVDVDPQVWGDWTELRKGKRAAITRTAIDGIRAEATKAGMSLDEALRCACKRGWTGFEAAWLTNGAGQSKQAALEARNKVELDKFVRGGDVVTVN